MRFPLFIPLVALATAVVGRPHDQAERELINKPRGLGELGAGAFAGAGAPAYRIEALQYLLHDWGHEVVSDGVWGPETQGAVSAVQPRVGLAADGVPGPATLGALVKEVAQGSVGNVVRAAQTALNGNGAQLAVDGDFGAGTKAAAVAYQGAQGLTADGIVGRDTWTALFGGGSGSTPPPTDPPPTDPEPTEPEPTDPAPTDPAPTDPAPTDPPPTDPPPTDPAPTDPAPTDPAPTDPAPTDPAPTDPAPTEPAPEEEADPRPMTDDEINDWKVCAYLAAIARCNMDAVDIWACGANCQWIENERGRPINVFAGRGSSENGMMNFYAARFKDNDKDHLVISIMGAVGYTQDEFLDTTLETSRGVVPVPEENEARIRAGHKAIALRIQTTLESHVREQVEGGVPDIIVVGHSQGGSIAEILAVAYKLQYPGVGVSVRAFNPPRTGNEAWANLVQEQLG